MFGGLAAAIGGITNGEPVYVWLPAVCLSLSGAISQWLQGEPSKETMLIARVLNLQPGMTNSDLAKNLVQRFIADQPKTAPPPAPPMAQRSRPIPLIAVQPEESPPCWSVPPASSPQLPNIPPPPADFAKTPGSYAGWAQWQADRLDADGDDGFSEIKQL
jgi:hypothetical protein